jgi:hypothetical protein
MNFTPVRLYRLLELLKSLIQSTTRLNDLFGDTDAYRLALPHLRAAKDYIEFGLKHPTEDFLPDPSDKEPKRFRFQLGDTWHGALCLVIPVEAPDTETAIRRARGKAAQIHNQAQYFDAQVHTDSSKIDDKNITEWEYL